MKTFRLWLNRLLRGRAATRLLERLGIQPRQYWLLADLFGELAERREMLGNLGTNKSALKMNAMILGAMTGFMAVLLILSNSVHAVSLWLYFAAFGGLTGVLMLGMLFSETGNSLVNPAEGMTLVHQPINGATYTAAKLTHLTRIVLFLSPALNAIPALGGLLLGAPWYYPLLHLAATFVLSMVIALMCCAVFGWLIRFVPARRLKTAGQVAEIFPWSMFMVVQNGQNLFRHVHFERWLPSSAAAGWGWGSAIVLGSAAAVAMGLRNLSGDYLVRVSAIMHGPSGAKSKVRRSWTSDLVARLFGGPSSRAGFEFLSRMVRRDWQLRRQLLPMLPSVGVLVAVSWRHLAASPFEREFTGAHVLPHFFGMFLFILCPMIVYGSDFKGAWVFLLAPAGAFRGFTRGLYAFLWVRLIVIPHLAILAVTICVWGPVRAVVYTAYSLAVASVYAGLVIRLIEGVPFSRQPQPTRQNYLLPIMFIGSVVIAIAVAVQYFLLFRSMAAVVAVTPALAIAAWLVTRHSLRTVETNIVYDLNLIANDGRVMFSEVEK
ncbi:MAG TPA: hypothetical protein VML19_01725 [Verrucomicrobiae bacterium]|nr:hypothetical protein [Verrucomicrobiae bacterium]